MKAQKKKPRRRTREKREKPLAEANERPNEADERLKEQDAGGEVSADPRASCVEQELEEVMARMAQLKRLRDMAGPEPDEDTKAMLEDAEHRMSGMMASLQSLMDSHLDVLKKETDMYEHWQGNEAPPPPIELEEVRRLRSEGDTSEIEAIVETARMPHGAEAYSKEDYWKQRYEVEIVAGTGDYDWYGQLSFEDFWLEARPLLEAQLSGVAPDQAQLLQIGAGNSSWSVALAEHLSTMGGTVLSTDIDEAVVEHMKEHTAGVAGLSWAVMDCTSLPLEAGAVSMVLDKAVVDALICAETLSQAVHTLCEAHRVLRQGGVFLVVSASLTSSDIQRLMEEAEAEQGCRWMLKTIPLRSTDPDRAEAWDGESLYVFHKD